jgi:hypothetical protein
MAMSVLLFVACQEAKEAQQFIAPACTLVEAVTADERVHAICAAEQELAGIVNTIRTARADAGPGRTATANCKIIPHTTMCATTSETAAAIDAALAKRGTP